MIRQILKTYPDLPFILIGDAGEKDIDIYLKITQEFGSQIKTIYIRSVDHKRKTKRVKQLIHENLNVDVFLIEKAHEAIAHAKKKQYISPGPIPPTSIGI